VSITIGPFDQWKRGKRKKPKARDICRWEPQKKGLLWRKEALKSPWAKNGKVEKGGRVGECSLQENFCCFYGVAQAIQCKHCQKHNFQKVPLVRRPVALSLSCPWNHHGCHTHYSQPRHMHTVTETECADGWDFSFTSLSL